jgi:hypothetical protein
MNPDAVFAETDLTRDSSTGYIDGEKVGELWTRYNANYVDLNRNWPTESWIPSFNYLYMWREGAGGEFGMSEPETTAVGYFMLFLNDKHENLVIINHHSYRYVQSNHGMAQPSYKGDWRDPEVNAIANELSKIYVEAAGTYEHLEKWTRYEVPGEFLGWAGEMNLAAFDIELPNQNDIHTVNIWGETHYQQALRATLAVIEAM